jgi:hypothetical protein
MQRIKRHAWLALHEAGMASVEAGTGDPLTNYVLGFLTAATLRPDYLAMLQSIP